MGMPGVGVGGGGGRMKWVKEVNCMMMDGNCTFGGEHYALYTDVRF